MPRIEQFFLPNTLETCHWATSVCCAYLRWTTWTLRDWHVAFCRVQRSLRFSCSKDSIASSLQMDWSSLTLGSFLSLWALFDFYVLAVCDLSAASSAALKVVFKFHSQRYVSCLLKRVTFNIKWKDPILRHNKTARKRKNLSEHITNMIHL